MMLMFRARPLIGYCYVYVDVDVAAEQDHGVSSTVFLALHLTKLGSDEKSVSTGKLIQMLTTRSVMNEERAVQLCNIVKG